MVRPTGALADPARVLVVDDDEKVAEVLSRYLEREGYDVDCCGDGAVALDRALSDPPDLVVLDIMLPGMDGLSVCRRLRAIAPVPIILLTARGEDADRIIGLELGADDYVVKPFSPREVVARVRAVLRRSRGDGPTGAAPGGPTALEAGELSIELGARRAWRRGQPLGLRAREFELLAFLMRNQGRAFTREELLEHVWGYAYGDTATVTVHVRRLRDKIEEDPAKPTHLVTVWGVGYRFDG